METNARRSRTSFLDSSCSPRSARSWLTDFAKRRAPRASRARALAIVTLAPSPAKATVRASSSWSVRSCFPGTCASSYWRVPSLRGSSRTTRTPRFARSRSVATDWSPDVRPFAASAAARAAGSASGGSVVVVGSVWNPGDGYPRRAPRTIRIPATRKTMAAVVQRGASAVAVT